VLLPASANLIWRNHSLHNETNYGTWSASSLDKWLNSTTVMIAALVMFALATLALIALCLFPALAD
jgi:hypothetical protein